MKKPGLFRALALPTDSFRLSLTCDVGQSIFFNKFDNQALDSTVLNSLIFNSL